MATSRSSQAVLAVLVLGGVLVLVGVTAFLAGGAGDTSTFVTTADGGTPLLADGVSLVRTVQWWGIGLVALGLVLASGAAGFRLGHRGPRR